MENLLCRYAITRFEVNRNWHRSWEVKAKAAKKKTIGKKVHTHSNNFPLFNENIALGNGGKSCSNGKLMALTSA